MPCRSTASSSIAGRADRAASRRSAAPFGIGRGIHLGDTIIGTKGRVAFEAPAAEVLLTAHRELEKLVLTARQQRIKDTLAGPYGDSCTRASTSTRCAATSRRCSCRRRSASRARCTCCSARASCSSRASTSPYSLMAASKGAYGESAGEWTAADAHGLFEDAGAAGHVLHARRASERRAAGASMQMKTVVVDKIASVTQACGLGHELRVATDRHSLRGRRGAGRRDPQQQVAPTTRSSSPAAAWPRSRAATSSSARSATARRCSATRATCPTSVEAGDILQMLNIGGVLGICDSVNPDKGKPFDCRVLGVRAAFSVPRRAHRRAGARRLSQARPRRRRSTRTACRSSRSPAPAWRPARPPRPARSSARMRHRGLVVRRVQGDGRLAAPRHPRDGGRRRAAQP